MGVMPAMRAPPLSVCRWRWSSATCAGSLRSRCHDMSAASVASSSSLASSRNTPASSASKSPSSEIGMWRTAASGRRGLTGTAGTSPWARFCSAAWTSDPGISKA